MFVFFICKLILIWRPESELIEKIGLSSLTFFSLISVYLFYRYGEGDLKYMKDVSGPYGVGC